MIRWFYARLLRLHPFHFRQRFTEEMLWIFDEAAAHGRTTQLSLMRCCRSGVNGPSARNSGSNPRL